MAYFAYAGKHKIKKINKSNQDDINHS